MNLDIFSRTLTFAMATALASSAVGQSAAGDVTLLDPPPTSVVRDQLTGTQPYLFLEQDDLVLPMPLTLDVVPGGTNATFDAGRRIDCWFLHLDRGPGTLMTSGSITFDADVLGFITSSSSLNRTDRGGTNGNFVALGDPGTTYPTGAGQRGLENSDILLLDGDRRVVTFEFRTQGIIDQIRIITAADPPFVPYCSGEACPCGNDALPGLLEGCVNSTGRGGALTFSGSQIVAQSDLSIRLENLPSRTFGIVFMGPARVDLPAGDGRMCVSPGPPGSPAGMGFTRFPIRLSTPMGVLVEPDVVGYANSNFGPGSLIAAGTTWHFQGCYRDVASTGCSGGGFNFTNALAVTFR